MKTSDFSSNLAPNICLTHPRWSSSAKTFQSTRTSTAMATSVSPSWPMTGVRHCLFKPSASLSSQCLLRPRKRSVFALIQLKIQEEGYGEQFLLSCRTTYIWTSFLFLLITRWFKASFKVISFGVRATPLGLITKWKDREHSVLAIMKKMSI